MKVTYGQPTVPSSTAVELTSGLQPAFFSGASAPKWDWISTATTKVKGEDVLKYPLGLFQLLFKVQGNIQAQSLAFPDFFTADEDGASNEVKYECSAFICSLRDVVKHSFGISEEQWVTLFARIPDEAGYDINEFTKEFNGLVAELEAEHEVQPMYALISKNWKDNMLTYQGLGNKLVLGTATLVDSEDMLCSVNKVKDRSYVNTAYMVADQPSVVLTGETVEINGKTYRKCEPVKAYLTDRVRIPVPVWFETMPESGYMEVMLWDRSVNAEVVRTAFYVETEDRGRKARFIYPDFK